MSAGKFDDAFSQGDVMRRLRALERKVDLELSGRRLESASVGRGGLRIQGGALTIRDISGDDMFRAGGDPGEVFIRQDLLAPLALAILGASIFSHTAEGEIIVPGATSGWVNDPDDGPRLSDVMIGPSGRALVMISSLFGGQATETVGSGGIALSIGARAGFQVSGPTEIEPSTPMSIATLFQFTSPLLDSGLINLRQRQGATFLVDDLNEGLHSFEMTYARLFTGEDALFADRNITVIAF